MQNMIKNYVYIKTNKSDKQIFEAQKNIDDVQKLETCIAVQNIRDLGCEILK